VPFVAQTANVLEGIVSARQNHQRSEEAGGAKCRNRKMQARRQQTDQQPHEEPRTLQKHVEPFITKIAIGARRVGRHQEVDMKKIDNLNT